MKNSESSSKSARFATLSSFFEAPSNIELVFVCREELNEIEGEVDVKDEEGLVFNKDDVEVDEVITKELGRVALCKNDLELCINDGSVLVETFKDDDAIVVLLAIYDLTSTSCRLEVTPKVVVVLVESKLLLVVVVAKLLDVFHLPLVKLELDNRLLVDPSEEIEEVVVVDEANRDVAVAVAVVESATPPPLFSNKEFVVGMAEDFLEDASRSILRLSLSLLLSLFFFSPSFSL